LSCVKKRYVRALLWRRAAGLAAGETRSSQESFLDKLGRDGDEAGAAGAKRSHFRSRTSNHSVMRAHAREGGSKGGAKGKKKRAQSSNAGRCASAATRLCFVACWRHACHGCSRVDQPDRAPGSVRTRSRRHPAPAPVSVGCCGSPPLLSLLDHYPLIRV
jgi:hypothetical protein